MAHKDYAVLMRLVNIFYARRDAKQIRRNTFRSVHLQVHIRRMIRTVG